MKIEEISKKSDNAPSTGSDAYANVAASAWAKPEHGTGHFDPKKGNEVGSGAAGEPGGGGSRPLENKDGTTATGSSAGEKAISTDKKINNDGTGEGNFAPPAKVTKPEEGKTNGEGKHSDKDAALQHLPSLSIV